MNQNQVKDALTDCYQVAKHRIVLWNDAEQGFADEVEQLLPEQVELIRLPGPSMLAVKIRVERDQPDTRFLIYDTREAPPQEEDWLLDIRQYAGIFSADRASVALGELGLDRLSLKPHLAKREKFLASKKRVAQLKALVSPSDTEHDLDLKMVAVLLDAETADLAVLLQRLFAGVVDPETGGLGRSPEGWQAICEMGLEPAFWQAVATGYQYTDEQPSLKAFLLRVLVSDLTLDAGETIPSWANLVLAEPGDRNAKVLVKRWQDSQRWGAAYDEVATEAETLLNVQSVLDGLPLETVLAIATFPCVEKEALRRVVEDMHAHAQQPALVVWEQWITQRENTHWVAPKASAGTDRAHFKKAYEALRAAAAFLDAWAQVKAEPWPGDLEGCWEWYTQTLWQIDQHHRHFNAAADALTLQRDVLKSLREAIERMYTQGYLAEVAQGWGAAASERLANWQVANVCPQQRFFDRHIRPGLEASTRSKVMVVVSDAFRYEAGQALVGLLNGRYRIEANMDAMLGVLPSYTKLGMAALLPHETLAYTPDADNVLVDGRSTGGTENRNAILQAHEGMAIQFDDLIGCTKAQGREKLDGARVVYVYHNQIDTVGDKADTEDQVFAATEKAIQDLGELINKAINSFNFNHVLVTADHGFLFSHATPQETQASRLGDLSQDAAVRKKRYVISETLPEIDQAHRGHTNQTGGTDTGMAFWLPKGVNLFHFAGGARYVHGGLMPQEVVVPLIRVKTVRGDKIETTRISTVALQVLAGPHRVTTGRHRFQVLQIDPVTERVQGVTAKIDIRHGGEPVSDTVTVKFDSPSSSFDERIQSVWLTLKDGDFDRSKVHTLTIRDAEDGRELTRADVIIDRAFSDDF